MAASAPNPDGPRGPAQAPRLDTIIDQHRPVLTDRAERIIEARIISIFADADIADLAVRECLWCKLILDGADEAIDHIKAKIAEACD